MQTEKRNCQNCKNEFLIESEDFSFYEKMKVPAPTFCQYCRAERRFSFRNEKRLFKVKDFLHNNDIFSLYPRESGKKILSNDDWRGDSWDAMDYARDYDFSRNFFQQFLELEKEIPVLAMRTQLMVDSPYCANATSLKNCYLCFGSSYSQDSMYGQYTDYSKDCIDNSHINHSERCYESFWLENCYQCYFSVICKESHNLYFCKNCLGCSDCFGCVDLRKASHCIFNKQYTKEGYEEEIKKMKLNTISGLASQREKARDFWLTKPSKNHQGLRNLNSTGSYVTDCNNVNDSYLIREGENMRFCQYMGVPKSKDCYDSNNWGLNMELHYETCLCGDNSFNVKFSVNCWPACKNIEYCMNLSNCSDCFGCVGLKKKQYCIFNKEYSKEEYQILSEKIKRQMNEIPYVDKKGNIYKYGEFFPIEFSPFGYNNTIAIQHFNMTKEEAIKNGYSWIEVEKGKYTITKKSNEITDSIDDCDDEILKEIIECEKCGGAYKLLDSEFTFYKKERLPIPTMCNECRYDRRIADRLKIHLYDRGCMCDGLFDVTGIYKNTITHIHGDEPCSGKFKTGYSPDSKEIVYCEKCYQQEVI